MCEKKHVSLKAQYRITSPRRATCMEEEVPRVEDGNIFDGLILRHNNGSKYSTQRKKKLHRGMVNRNNRETVLLSSCSLLLLHMKDKMDGYEDKVPKALINECRLKFSDHTISLFRKTKDQRGYTLLSLFKGRNQDEVQR